MFRPYQRNMPNSPQRHFHRNVSPLPNQLLKKKFFLENDQNRVVILTHQIQSIPPLQPIRMYIKNLPSVANYKCMKKNIDGLLNVVWSPKCQHSCHILIQNKEYALEALKSENQFPKMCNQGFAFVSRIEPNYVVPRKKGSPSRFKNITRFDTGFFILENHQEVYFWNDFQKGFYDEYGVYYDQNCLPTIPPYKIDEIKRRNQTFKSKQDKFSSHSKERFKDPQNNSTYCHLDKIVNNLKSSHQHNQTNLSNENRFNFKKEIQKQINLLYRRRQNENRFEWVKINTTNNNNNINNEKKQSLSINREIRSKNRNSCSFKRSSLSKNKLGGSNHRNGFSNRRILSNEKKDCNFNFQVWSNHKIDINNSYLRKASNQSHNNQHNDQIHLQKIPISSRSSSLSNNNNNHKSNTHSNFLNDNNSNSNSKNINEKENQDHKKQSEIINKMKNDQRVSQEGNKIQVRENNFKYLTNLKEDDLDDTV